MSCGHSKAYCQTTPRGCCRDCGHTAEKDAAFSSLREQVEQIERLNQRAGYPVPEGALICLPYTEARALLDHIFPPGTGAGE